MAKNTKQIARNKKAYFDYEIIEEFETGVVLKGYEVKSVKSGRVNLKGAHVSVFSDGPYVMDMHIGSYPMADLKDYHPKKKRKLLLKSKEIDKIRKAETTAGLAIIPLTVYLKGGLVKLKIAICRGKKRHDKRQALKRKAQDRQVERAIRNM